MATGSEDFNSLYPEPPQGVFASPASLVNQHLSPDRFFPRAAHHDFFPPPSSAVPLSSAGALFADTPFATMFAAADHLSPATLYNEDPDLRIASSSLSTASGPSAPSSAVGSPRSHHDLPPTIAEWPAPPGLSVSPNIVGHGDFYAPGEYSYSSSHMDEFAHFEFPQPPKSFVADPSVLHSDVRPAGLSAFDAYQAHAHAQAQAHAHAHAHAHAQAQAHAQAHAHAQSAPPQQQPTPAVFPVSPAHSPELKADGLSPFPSAAAAVAFQQQQQQQYASPFLAPTPMDDRGSRDSRSSFSGFSASDPQFSDGEGKEKQRCPHPDCGKRFKDLRAHMLTHQTERPEKCPIQTCEYHTKGFARKYDKNRHTLTHYKGTMVCGFCPGSGSPAEKSFNRADVFKRHLTAVHGVEQTAPNSRKKTAGAASGAAAGAGGSGGGGVSGAQKLTTYAPDATGKCSTCSQTFSNAQEFYEHLDDCVLRIVQQEDPAEAVNASRLAEVENDQEVKATLEKNQVLSSAADAAAAAAPEAAVDDEDDEDMDDEEAAAAAAAGAAAADDASPVAGSVSSSPKKLLSKSGSIGSIGSSSSGNPANGVQKARGMTHSRGGVPFTGKTRSRRSRQNYPTSWGFDKGQMTMRKRVMTVFEGPRRLAKDDMMLSTEHEVRLKLSDGKAYVTDLDVQTLKRAEGFLTATEEEKGLWISNDPTEEQLKQMQTAI